MSRKDFLQRTMSATTKEVAVQIRLSHKADEPAHQVANQCKKLLDWVENGSQLDLDLPESNQVTVCGAELRVDQPEDDQQVGSIGLDFALAATNHEAVAELYSRMERGERFNVRFISLGVLDDPPADIEEEVETEGEEEREEAAEV